MNKNNYYLLFLILVVFNFLYFKVNAQTFTDTQNVSVNAVVVGSTPVPPTSGGGGGGGGGFVPIILPQTSVQFKGKAYPNSEVVVLKNGVILSSIFADADGFFNLNIPEDQAGNTLYSLYAIDKNKIKSSTINLPAKTEIGYLNFVSNIIFAPTIYVDKNEVSASSSINVNGYGSKNTQIEIIIKNSLYSKTFKITTNNDGTYSANLSMLGIPKGSYNVIVKYQNEGSLNQNSKLIISDKDILNNNTEKSLRGDCNKDNTVNIVDFSIMAFWYKKINHPKCVDLNNDNSISLIDFSILAFNWTN